MRHVGFENIVYVVDDDVRVCESLRELFTSLHMASVTFGSVTGYLAHPKPDLLTCLILDAHPQAGEERVLTKEEAERSMSSLTKRWSKGEGNRPTNAAAGASVEEQGAFEVSSTEEAP